MDKKFKKKEKIEEIKFPKGPDVSYKQPKVLEFPKGDNGAYNAPDDWVNPKGPDATPKTPEFDNEDPDILCGTKGYGKLIKRKGPIVKDYEDEGLSR